MYWEKSPASWGLDSWKSNYFIVTWVVCLRKGLVVSSWRSRKENPVENKRLWENPSFEESSRLKRGLRRSESHRSGGCMEALKAAGWLQRLQAQGQGSPARKVSAELWKSVSCVLGGSNTVSSNPGLRKWKSKQKACYFLYGWNCSKEDIGLLYKSRNNSKRSTFVFFFFRLCLTDLLYPKMLLPL